MGGKTTGHYVVMSVGGESVNAFVPDPLPSKLTKRVLPELKTPLLSAVTALARLNLAGEMIPSLEWLIYAFVRKEALLSSEIEGTQATLNNNFTTQLYSRFVGIHQNLEPLFTTLVSNDVASFQKSETGFG